MTVFISRDSVDYGGVLGEARSNRLIVSQLGWIEHAMDMVCSLDFTMEVTSTGIQMKIGREDDITSILIMEASIKEEKHGLPIVLVLLL